MSAAPEEVWRPVPRNEGWTDASSLGRARRWYAYEAGARRLVWLATPVIVKPGLCGGYKRVCLQNELNGPVRSVGLHRLVLEAHVGPCPDGFLACHFPSKDPGCCELGSLRWDSRVANIEDDRVHRTCDHALILARLLSLRETHGHLRVDIDGLRFRRPRKHVPHLDNLRSGASA